MYEFHCPKLKAPQVKSYDPDEYLDRTNTALSVAQNRLFEIRKKEPERAKALNTDTLAELYQYNFITMAQKLCDSPKTLNLKTSYEALKAKFWLMTSIGGTATATEQKHCHGYRAESHLLHAQQRDRQLPLHALPSSG